MFKSEHTLKNSCQYNNFNAEEIWNSENRKNLKNFKTIVLFSIIFSLIISSFMLIGFANSPGKTSLGQNGNKTLSYGGLVSSTDDYVRRYSKQLVGSFSNVVSMSVSPLTSLTILTGAGTIQGIDVEKYPFLQPLKNMLVNLPIDLSRLPLANMDSFLVIFSIFILCFILRALHYTKIFTVATVNRIENWFGQIISILLVALSTSSTQVFAASAITTQQNNVSTEIYVVTFVVSIIAPVASGIIYYFIKTVCLCLEVLVYITSALLPPVIAVPISTGFETLRSLVSLGLTILTFLNPALSIVISIIISIICTYLFKKSYNVVTYFKFIYIKPFWNAIFHKNKMFPLVLSNAPKRITSLFNNIEIALPVFPLKRIQKIGKKEKCWLVFDGGKSYICKNRVIRKPICISVSELINEDNTIFMQKTFRFLRIFSDEQLKDTYKKLIAVISREYNNQFEDIVETLCLVNYNEFEKARKEERRIQREQDKMARLLTAQAKKEEMVKKKHELKVQSIMMKQGLKAKNIENRVSIKQLKKHGKNKSKVISINSGTSTENDSYMTDSYTQKIPNSVMEEVAETK